MKFLSGLGVGLPVAFILVLYGSSELFNALRGGFLFPDSAVLTLDLAAIHKELSMKKAICKIFSAFKRAKEDVEDRATDEVGAEAKDDSREKTMKQSETGRLMKWLVSKGLPVDGEYNQAEAIAKVFPRTEADFTPVGASGEPMVAMDAKAGGATVKGGLRATKKTSASTQTAINRYGINDTVLQHFQNRGFIGWASCAILAQHEVINRACSIPAEDAIAHGYRLRCASPSHNGTSAHEKSESTFLTDIKKVSDKMGMNDICIQLSFKKRVFGVGLAVPRIEGADYEKPYNPDGIKKNSYKGFAVIDPYWLTYELDDTAQADPTSPNFYEPNFYRMPNGKRVHKSWVVRVVNSHVPDMLKPTYYFGGIPLTQMLYERVFCADKIANEAPLLAMTKRLLIADANVEELMADDAHASKMMKMINYFRDNFSIFFKKPNSQVSQIDTTLGEFNQLIMTQYQLVASIAQMPATKLLKVTPTGFQSTGEYEWKDYAQLLLDIQTNDYMPLLEFHYELLLRSGYPDREDLKVSVGFNAIDVPTMADIATVESRVSQVISSHINSGVITPEEARSVLRTEDGGLFANLAPNMPDILKRMMEAKDPANQQPPMPGGGMMPMPGGEGGEGAPPADGAEGGDPAPDEGDAKAEEYSKVFVDAVHKAAEVAGEGSETLSKFLEGGNAPEDQDAPGGEKKDDDAVPAFAGMVKKAVQDKGIAFDQKDVDAVVKLLVAVRNVKR